MNIECHLTVKETARMQLEKPADWTLYVHSQAVVLQQKLEHSMRTQCYCCWSRPSTHDSWKVCGIIVTVTKEISCAMGGMFPQLAEKKWFLAPAAFLLQQRLTLFRLLRSGAEIFLYGPQINFCLPTQSRF